MSIVQNSDCFTVASGPEDGAAFPITRAPFEIGCDNACAVVLQLDASVLERHAWVGVESEGYRIRGLGHAPVYVNGKRAGRIRSRVVRNGDFIKVGHTELVLECAAGGLASRSRGIGFTSDWQWALAYGTRAVIRGVGQVLGRIAGTLRWAGRSRTVWLAAAVAAYLFVPAFRGWVWRLIDAVRGTVFNILN